MCYSSLPICYLISTEGKTKEEDFYDQYELVSSLIRELSKKGIDQFSEFLFIAKDVEGEYDEFLADAARNF